VTAPARLPPCPAGLLDATGAPRPGAFAGAHDAVALAGLASPGLVGRLRHLARAKAWVWAVVVSDDVLAAVAIVEAGYFAGGFAWALDRRSGAVLFEASAAGVPGRTARVASRAGGPARLTARGLTAELAPDGAALALRVHGRGFAVEAALEPAGAPAPFTLVVPVPGGGVRATTKQAGLAARGRVTAAGTTRSLEGGAGGLDFTAGVLARDTAWRWAFATGRVAGAPFGFNLCEGFGVAADDPGENAAFAGAPYRLPAVRFEVGGAKRPWRVASADGTVDLRFAPQGAHAEARNLGLVSTRFVQVAGTFDGVVPGPDGAPVGITALPGVVEDHSARW
jgi:hypothetical protein